MMPSRLAEITDLPVLMKLWKNWVTKEVLLERLDGFTIAVMIDCMAWEGKARCYGLFTCLPSPRASNTGRRRGDLEQLDN